MYTFLLALPTTPPLTLTIHDQPPANTLTSDSRTGGKDGSNSGAIIGGVIVVIIVALVAVAMAAAVFIFWFVLNHCIN